MRTLSAGNFHTGARRFVQFVHVLRLATWSTSCGCAFSVRADRGPHDACPFATGYAPGISENGAYTLQMSVRASYEHKSRADIRTTGISVAVLLECCCSFHSASNNNCTRTRSGVRLL
jgi:hypothetical protein